MSRHTTNSGSNGRFRPTAGVLGIALFVCQSLAACKAPAETSVVGTDEPESYSVVVSGHLYSLYVRNKLTLRDEVVFDEAVLSTFANELSEIEPRATFFLGDNTRFALAEEWQMLNRIFADAGGQKVFVPGNHDHEDIRTFDESGGLRNASIEIGRNKFVVLDSKTVFDQADLAFIEREVADHESYDNVFIMMHFMLIGASNPEGEIDPFAQYDNQSNWNRDVVPLIAGKVDYVFSGDYYPAHAGRTVQHFEGEQIHYVRNSFMFRRGWSDDETGDGPMVFLELRFEGRDFSIVPHALSVDLKSSWYEDFNVPSRFKEDYIYETDQFQSDWNKHVIANAFTLPVPKRWNVQSGDGEAELSVSDDSGSIDLRVYSYKLDEKTSFARFGQKLLADATRSIGSDPTIEESGRLKSSGVEVLWTISELFRDTNTKRGLNLWFMHKGVGYLITCKLPTAEDKYSKRVTELFTLFTAVNAIEFGD